MTLLDRTAGYNDRRIFGSASTESAIENEPSLSDLQRIAGARFLEILGARVEAERHEYDSITIRRIANWLSVSREQANSWMTLSAAAGHCKWGGLGNAVG